MQIKTICLNIYFQRFAHSMRNVTSLLKSQISNEVMQRKPKRITLCFCRRPLRCCIMQKVFQIIR